MAIIRRYIEAGKPVVGIRTACHAFDTRGHAPPGHVEWTTFDPDVLGGHYTGHHGNDLKPVIERVDTKKPVADPRRGRDAVHGPGLALQDEPAGVVGDAAVDGHGSPGIRPSRSRGSTARANARIFYTSLGHPGDFDNPRFRRLLRNAVLWALDRHQANSTPGPRRRRAAPSSRIGQGPLAPAAALASFRVPDDLELELVLAEPIVRQPVSMNFDERGRLWVVQYLQYPVSRRA